jgi:putative ABC transport system substrate-binding protein
MGAAIALRPPLALAQESGRKYRLGVVVQQPRAAYAVLFEELGRLGFAEGGNLTVDPRGFAATVERLEILAREVVAEKPDAIFAGGDAAARAVQQATNTIPIVTLADDVLGNQLAPSFSRPEHNLTGVSILAGELNAKRLELLIELLPGARHLAALVDPSTTAPDQLDPVVEVARSRGVEVSIHRAGTEQAIASAIDDARASGAQGLNVFASALLNVNRKLIIERSESAGLPAIYQFPEHCADGGLVGYGSRLSSVFRQTAGMLAKIMSGKKPAEVPVEQPMTVELCLNLKIAKALNVAVPQSLLARADEVIE